MTAFPRKTVERLIIIASSILLTLPFVGRPLRLEYGLLDFRFGIARGGPADETLDRVVVILADTDSEERLGRPYDSSWREFYPSFIDTLEGAGARVIVWDAAFAASRPEFDPALAERLSRGIPVVAGEDASSETVPALRGSFNAVGWLPFVGTDAMPRRVPAVHDPPPLSWIAGQYLRDGDRAGPVAAGSLPAQEVWIDYTYSLDQIMVFSLADVLLSDGQRLANELRTPVSVFRNRVVFVGLSLPATDRYPLPGTGGARVPGVYSQVAAAFTFSGDRQIVRVGFVLNLLASGILALTLTVVWTLSQRTPRRVATVTVVVFGLLAPVVLFSFWKIWVSYSAVIVSLIVPLVGVGIARRMWLTRSYRTSLGFDPELIEKHKDLIESYSAGVEREAVVLCSDVRDYTQFVTDNAPDKIQKVMSEYMAAMEAIVDGHGGYVNKYVGDEIVAVFGFPRNEKDVVNRSVRAALAMLEHLEELKRRWVQDGYPALEAIGIGLDAGPLRFTHIGGEHRVQFDIIGNPINGASRLQVLTKEHGRPLVMPAEMVEAQSILGVSMYGDDSTQRDANEVSFIGEVLVRGQGRRRVYGLNT